MLRNPAAAEVLSRKWVDVPPFFPPTIRHNSRGIERLEVLAFMPAKRRSWAPQASGPGTGFRDANRKPIYGN
jgi:hypothetical protein